METTSLKLKPIPSTIQRGRMSHQQQHVFATELDNYCIDFNNIKKLTSLEANLIFNNYSRLIIDIGFGNGDQLLQLSEQLPSYNFIGIELYKKGIATLIKNIKHKNIKNIKIIYGDAKELLKNFDNQLIFKVQIFFPDPWPKLRHHKRRLINQDLLNIIKHKLLPNGILHIVTDSDNYSKHIIQLMQRFPEFNHLQQHNIQRPTTKFEKTGLSLGNNISDMVFVLQSSI